MSKTRNLSIEIFLIFTTIIFLFCSSDLFAVCPTDQDVRTKAIKYLQNQPLNSYDETLSLEDAYCAQKIFVAHIKENQDIIGYKVGMTGKAIQERFHISAPITGILLEEMIVPDGSTLNIDFGLRPFIEPDMIVTVKDEGIMNARNELEVATHLDMLHPFIELPAIQLKENADLTAPTIVAFNVAARKGVYGSGIKIKATQEFVESLETLETIFTDETGEVLQIAPGSNLFGNPLNVVLWLIDELKQRGETLRSGQLISLGSLGKMFPLTERGKTYTLTYKGLPCGPLSTSIHID
jgi:2-keto-4-pentenoate hydratase